jgi:hypothetical protein
VKDGPAANATELVVAVAGETKTVGVDRDGSVVVVESRGDAAVVVVACGAAVVVELGGTDVVDAAGAVVVVGPTAVVVVVSCGGGGGSVVLVVSMGRTLVVDVAVFGGWCPALCRASVASHRGSFGALTDVLVGLTGTSATRGVAARVLLLVLGSREAIAMVRPTKKIAAVATEDLTARRTRRRRRPTRTAYS